MVPVSAQDVHEYTPPGAGDPAPVFLLRTPTLRQRAAWRRDIAAAGARFVSTGELYELLRQAIRETRPANLEELLELVDQHEAALDGRIAFDEELNARMRALEQAMVIFQPYAELVAARSYWLEIANLQAFRHFVAGWRDLVVDGAPLAYQARNGLVAEELVDRVPEAFLFYVATAAMGLLTPNAEQRKNSGSPLPSPSGPATSDPTAPASGSA